MRHPLAFLLVRSLRGRLLRMARRLREPRYLVGFVVGAGWSLFWLSRIFFSSGRDVHVRFGLGDALTEMTEPLIHSLEMGLGLVLAVGVTIWWLVPLGRSSLELSEAELHVLLPAPIARRRIIQYGILRGQPGVLFGAAIMTFFSGVTSPVGTLGRFVGVWLLLTIWDLHAKGRGLWLSRQHEVPPATAFWRRSLLTLAMAAVWIVLVAGLVDLVPGLLTSLPADWSGVQPWLRDAGQQQIAAAWNGPLGWALTPFVWLLGPYLAIMRQAPPGDVGRAFVAPLALLAIHYEWVVRSQVRFEEAELAHARRRSRQVDPASRYWRLSERRRSWHPFDLGRGGPELALVWKNLMLLQRIPARLLFAGLGAALVLTLAVLASGWVPAWIVALVQLTGVLLIVVPPMIGSRSLRCDLRNDLVHLETLRAWPIVGWRLFLAEIGAPVVVTGVQILTGCALLLGIDAISWLGRVEGSMRTGFGSDLLGVPPAAVVPLAVLTLLPLAVGISVLSISLENLAALAFPSWVHLGMDRKQAAAKFGQNLVVFLVLSLALLAGLAPGLIAVAIVLAAQLLVWQAPVSGWELPLLGLIAALPTAVVAAALVRAGGTLWDRLDPSQELLEGGV